MTNTETTTTTWTITEDGTSSPSFGPYEVETPALAAAYLLADIFGDVARGRCDGAPTETSMEVDNEGAVVTVEWCDLDGFTYTIEYRAEAIR